VISIAWTDPATAALWANEYVALANELIRTRALQHAESNIEYLRKQVEETNVVELERVIYNLIESQIQTLMLANAREEYAFIVVDPAVAPETRTTPRRKLIVLSGGALGVFFGVLAVFVINIFRQITTRELPKSG
jgi:LPS O-antigen subunit length determinant protein (WzzB/FepE family)